MTETIAPLPWYADNAFTRTFGPLKYYDPADGKYKYMNTATIAGFIAAITDERELPTAVAAHADLAFSCPLIAGAHGKYAVQLAANKGTYATANPIFGTPVSSGILFADQFARADSALTMGTPWTPAGNGVNGVSSARAYAVTAASGGEAEARTDAGRSDFIVKATLAVAGSDQFLSVRRQDSLSAGLFLEALAGMLVLYSDDFYPIRAEAYTPASGDRWEVRCFGPVVSVYINDVLLFAQEGVTEYETESFVGLGFPDLAVRWDNVVIESLATPTPYLVLYQAGVLRRHWPLEYIAAQPGEVAA